MEKTQLFLIHGGMTFKTQEDYINYLKTRKIRIDRKIRWWEDYLRESLEDSCNVIIPRMPLEDNAKYEDWKIYFERFFASLKENIILIGVSLGGHFLAKYLSENKFPKKILSVYLIAPSFDDNLPNEALTEDFALSQDLSLIEQNCKNINLLFSKDDDCVPVSHAEKFREKLPNANIVIYESKNGHFQISEFPEIVKMIKKDLKQINL
jgi:predicted alpha/beta hydrolase family esterase